MKKISAGFAIYRAKQDFGITTSHWITDATHWIKDVLDEIGYGVGLINVYKDIPVSNYKAVAPCDDDFILFIEFCGRRLSKSNSPVSVQGGDKTTIVESNVEWWFPNGSYIHTSFEKGTIRIFMLELERDSKDGFPLIPYNTFFINAIKFYILMQLLSQGFNSMVFNYKSAIELYEINVARAQNYYKLGSPEDREATSNMWTRQKFNTDFQENFYVDSQLPESIHKR